MPVLDVIDWPYPQFCAHRGAGKLAPENTLAAFRLGHAHGYRMVECDVKLAADGVAFLLHDATLERTTNAQGRADARTWRELSQLDGGSWHSKAYAGEPLPTLAAVARFALAHDVAVNVEIKPTPGRERETGAAIAQDAAALWRNAAIPPLLSSFSPQALEAAADAVSSLPRAFLCDRFDDDTLPQAITLGCIALDTKHTLLTPDVIKRAKDAKLRLVAWTVNEAKRASELRALGVDTIITDAIDAISPVVT